MTEKMSWKEPEVLRNPMEVVTEEGYVYRHQGKCDEEGSKGRIYFFTRDGEGLERIVLKVVENDREAEREELFLKMVTISKEPILQKYFPKLVSVPRDQDLFRALEPRFLLIWETDCGTSLGALIERCRKGDDASIAWMKENFQWTVGKIKKMYDDLSTLGLWQVDFHIGNICASGKGVSLIDVPKVGPIKEDPIPKLMETLNSFMCEKVETTLPEDSQEYDEEMRYSQGIIKDQFPEFIVWLDGDTPAPSQETQVQEEEEKQQVSKKRKESPVEKPKPKKVKSSDNQSESTMAKRVQVVEQHPISPLHLFKTKRQVELDLCEVCVPTSRLRGSALTVNITPLTETISSYLKNEGSFDAIMEKYGEVGEKFRIVSSFSKCLRDFMFALVGRNIPEEDQQSYFVKLWKTCRDDSPLIIDGVFHKNVRDTINHYVLGGEFMIWLNSGCQGFELFVALNQDKERRAMWSECKRVGLDKIVPKLYQEENTSQVEKPRPIKIKV